MENQIVLIDVQQLKQIVADAFHQQGEVYSLKDTCRKLQLSAPTVRKLIREKKLVGTEVGKRILISQRSINQFMNGQE
jgi:excisionase family DNA binding protein